jgi:hypothetical protein
MRFLATAALVMASVGAAVPAAGTTTASTTTTTTTASTTATTTTTAHTRAEHAGHSGHAMPGMHADSVRYASLKKCAKKKDKVPCGPWQLYLHSGKKEDLKDARVFPLDAHGKINKDVPAPMAVSGDGQYIAYVRARDDRLVVRERTGKVHVMPADALPKGTSMAHLTLDLSLTGNALAVEHIDQKFIRVFDVAGGEMSGTIPAGRAFGGFSGDEDEVLTTMGTDDNTTEVITYDLQGNEVKRREPPQIVADQSPGALNADGRSIAFYSRGTHTLKVYDLDSDTVTGSTRVRFPGGETPSMIDWTGIHQVTVHIPYSGDGDKPVVMRIFQVDPETGSVKLRDSYSIKNAFVYAACGG